MRQAKEGDETIDMPVIMGGTAVHKENCWLDDVAAVWAGDEKDAQTWRLGFVDKDYWLTHTKTIDGKLFITLPK